ncbi:MAG: hypothetical protein CMA72_09220 [Euryarchaeota archaeon]|nr:hypothetical protein [Euryarchaeota archaeon]
MVPRARIVLDSIAPRIDATVTAVAAKYRVCSTVLDSNRVNGHNLGGSSIVHIYIIPQLDPKVKNYFKVKCIFILG